MYIKYRKPYFRSGWKQNFIKVLLRKKTTNNYLVIALFSLLNVKLVKS